MEKCKAATLLSGVLHVAHTPALPDAVGSLRALSSNVPRKGFCKLLVIQKSHGGLGSLFCLSSLSSANPGSLSLRCQVCLPVRSRGLALSAPSPTPDPDPLLTPLTPSPGADLYSHLDGIPHAPGSLVSSRVQPMEAAAGVEEGGERGQAPWPWSLLTPPQEGVYHVFKAPVQGPVLGL